MRTLALRPIADPVPASAGCEARTDAGLAAVVLDTQTGAPWAGVLTGNPLDGLALPAEAPGGRLIIESGWVADDDGAPGVRTWTGDGWKALHAWADAIAPVLRERGTRVLFRTDARHVLSDPQGSLTWLREREKDAASPFGLLLDPAAMLTPSMLGDVEVHIGRALDALAHRDDVDAVLLAGAVEVDGELTRAPVGEGSPDAAVWARLWSTCGSGETPLIFRGDAEIQVERLTAATTA